MKLIRLEILNLASLDRKEGEVIDFESGVLKNCTIFSIVGPMGSGKSTLLDAICLALYNRAPRLVLVDIFLYDDMLCMRMFDLILSDSLKIHRANDHVVVFYR